MAAYSTTAYFVFRLPLQPACAGNTCTHAGRALLQKVVQRYEKTAEQHKLH